MFDARWNDDESSLGAERYRRARTLAALRDGSRAPGQAADGLGRGAIWSIAASAVVAIVFASIGLLAGHPHRPRSPAAGKAAVVRHR